MEFRLHSVVKFIDVKRFYEKLFLKNRSDIPIPVEKKFRAVFRRPVGVEWMVTGNDYEALFHENKLEHIARFDGSGNLLELRTNIAPLDMASIKNEQVRKMGTLMNYIQIWHADTTTHELIIKKPDLTRILVLLNDNYDIIKEEPL